MSLGKKIQKRRKELGISAADLADSLGISHSSMSNIENDRLKGGPLPEIVVKIAEDFNDNSILLHYLEENPVYRAIIPLT
ncbi:helix-turn-helix transcriptional regulator [Desulfuromonas thiophila]|uniref:helix-turn-helix transcriptional regulator n=1 Tax=Desulfuromonas thiophila TaxID=57664 RepID=UPI00389944E8